ILPKENFWKRIYTSDIKYVPSRSRNTGFTNFLGLTHGFGRTRHSCRFSMLCDVGRGEANGRRDSSRPSDNTTLQSLVADAGAFLYGHVWSGKQNVWRLDANYLERAVRAGK